MMTVKDPSKYLDANVIWNGIMKANLDDIRQRTTDVSGYIDTLSSKDQDLLQEMYDEYILKEDILDELREATKDLCIVVFSAPWCKDCKVAMPVLRHLQEQIGLEVRIFGNIKTAPLDPNVKWAVPPSPPETNEWGLTAIPYFFFFKKDDGEKVAVLIEKPTVNETLEEEMLYVLKHK